MDGDDLFIYLPSSVKSSIQENTVSHYTTTLNSPLRLPSDVPYECAVAKVIFPSEIKNVYDGHFEYFSYVLKRVIPSRLPDGYYVTTDDIVNKFKEILGELDKEAYKFSTDNIANRFLVEMTKPEGRKRTPFMKFSENLTALTGSPRFIQGEGFTVGTHPFNMSGGIQNLYLYCDLVHNAIIGNTLAPLILVFSYKKDDGSQQEYEPKNLVYTPLNKNIINDITIETRTKTGLFVPFLGGEMLILLHLRPRIPKL